jgi:hypothetical protein
VHEHAQRSVSESLDSYGRLFSAVWHPKARFDTSIGGFGSARNNRTYRGTLELQTRSKEKPCVLLLLS